MASAASSRRIIRMAQAPSARISAAVARTIAYFDGPPSRCWDPSEIGLYVSAEWRMWRRAHSQGSPWAGLTLEEANAAGMAAYLAFDARRTHKNAAWRAGFSNGIV